MARSDPAELYDLEPDRPDLSDVVLVQALDGFIDAGSAVRLARAHLVSALEGRVIARFDVDRLFDYRARRPTMHFARDHWESFDAPELVVRLLEDDGGAPFLLLSGPEPDVQWELFVEAVMLLSRLLGVRLVVGLNAFPMGLPHTRPVRTILHGSRPELFEGYRPWLGTLAVPGSAGHLLEFRLAQAGRDSLGIAAPVPPYVSDSEYPAASAALLREVSTRTGLLLPVSALDDAAETTRLAIDAQVAKSTEVQAVVAALEQQYDSYVDAGTAEPLADAGDLPSADELGAELERFLAEQGRSDPPPGPRPE